MKKNRNAFFPMILLYAAFFTVTSCQKEDPAPEPSAKTSPTPSVVSNDFFAEVDGHDFFESNFTGTVSNGNLLLSASKSGGESIGLILPVTIGVGTYTFDGIVGPKTGTYAVSTAQSGQYMVGSGTGTLEIKFHDKENDIIRGYFTYTATPVPGSSAMDSHEITAGTFTYNY